MSRDQRAYLLAGLACLLFVMTRYLTAGFYDNEEVYALNPLKILDASFLPGDSFLPKVYPFFLVFDVLVTPAYWLLAELPATILIRVAIWVFQIWALFRLLRTLGVTWWGCIALFVLWLNVEQTLVAGDWIIGCASSKPVAYGFVFLALDALLRDRVRACGVYCGVATAFHIIAGFWSTLAIGIVLLVTRGREIGLRGLITFGVAVFLCALPGVAPAVWAEMFVPYEGAEVTTANVAEISVRLVNPYHLDPSYFMTGLEPLKVIVFYGLTLLLLFKLLPAESRRALFGFTAAVGVFFVSGLIASAMGSYGYLKYYPFRIADSFVPLLFWIGIVLLFQRVMEHSRRGGIALILLIPLQIGAARYVVEITEPDPEYELTPRSFATAMLRTEPRLTAYWIRERGREWLAPATPTDFEQLAEWVRSNTPTDSLFLTPPYEASFAILAQRPQFVSLQVPVGPRLVEWKSRIDTINRGPLQNVGWEIWGELRDNYPRLTTAEVTAIRDAQGVDYFLTNSKQDYAFELVYENAAFRLYRM